MKKYRVLIPLLVLLPVFLLAGCVCEQEGWLLVGTEQLGGETYTIPIVTSPLEAKVTIDKEYKGVTPLKISYTAPQYEEQTWHYRKTSYPILGCYTAEKKVEYIDEEPYSAFVEQDRVLSIEKANYEDVVIVFNMNNANTKIPEIIKLVRRESALSPEDRKKEQQLPQQQQQMMGPTIVIGGKTVTGDDAVKIVNYGLVMFDSTPQEAEVLIEGNLIGYTPTAYLKFEVGTYNAEIVKIGYQPWERRILVIQDSSIVINPELERR